MSGQPAPGPDLTIYVPTYRRTELRALLRSLRPQLTPRVEVFISDNDPERWSFPIVAEELDGVEAPVHYSARRSNIGGDANVLRGFTQGSAPWVWVIGDDDAFLPGAVEAVLTTLDETSADRLIVLSPQAPTDAAGTEGTLADIAEADPSLLIATTLISANVLRRAALDVAAGYRELDTKFGHAWANTTCTRLAVLSHPAITVGLDHAGEGVRQDFLESLPDIWLDLLHRGYQVPTTYDEATRWNFVSVQEPPLSPPPTPETQPVGGSAAETPEEPAALRADRDRLALLLLRAIAERDDLAVQLTELRTSTNSHASTPE